MSCRLVAFLPLELYHLGTTISNPHALVNQLVDFRFRSLIDHIAEFMVLHYLDDNMKGNCMTVGRYNFFLPQLIWVCLCFPFVCGSGIAQTQVVLGASKDNTLYETTDGSLSNGAGPGFFVGENNLGAIRRGVIAFDIVGNIPSGATITSAALGLTVSRSSSGPKVVQLRKLLSNWGEGTSVGGGAGGGAGGPSTTGDATWIHTFFNTSFWSTPGGDFSGTTSASQTVGDFGDFTWGSTPQMVSDVQGWLNNPSSNFGWLVLGIESTPHTAKRFDSREGASPPQLTVVYNTTSVEERGGVPEKFALYQNYPNPFNPSTKIPFTVPFGVKGLTSLKVYDALGQEVATLVNDVAKPGNYLATWDATGHASGVYYYRLNIGGVTASRKLLLMR